MSSIELILLAGVGLLIGVVSGLVGIGGGILVIPVLMIGFAFSQAEANGTSLAMLLPPIGIFAVLAYSRAGYVNWRFALVLAAGFAPGAYLGAWLVSKERINPTALRILFALLLAYVAARLLFRPGGRARAGLEVALLVSGYAVAYTFMRLLGRHMRDHPKWSSVYHRRLHASVEHDYEI